jgi:23S rRNA (cytidine1920-2'-O)/16S rRNA (cytidine1409-2'-O)-methyltransferase
MAKQRSRLDEALVARGLLPDARTAQAWILAGDVLVGDRVCAKPGTLVAGDVLVALRRPVDRYVSRGGLKLEAALDRFAIDVTGKVVLDAGASTGGFSDCLLQRGAARVYAVDVGHGQIRGKLASDPRLVNLERTNISDLSAARLDPPIDLCVFDLSYISATRAVPILATLFAGRPPALVGLVKPLFEGVPPEQMQDPAALREALRGVLAAFAAGGFTVQGLMASPIQGNRGTIEFLTQLAAGPPAAPSATDSLVDRAIGEVAGVAASPLHRERGDEEAS